MRSFVAVVAVVALSGACKSKSEDKGETEPPPPAEPEPAPVEEKEPEVAPESPDKGDFKAHVARTQNEDFGVYRDLFVETKLFELLADELNETFNLPHDVKIGAAECGEPNAFYDPDRHEVIFCYEMLALIHKTFEDSDIDSDDELTEAFLGATFFILFHELGHALVHTFELPITGKEEDAVDQLATVIVIDEGGDEGVRMALDGALLFLSLGENDDFEDLPFWGEHSLGQQRFYNILCWVYGRDASRHELLVTEGMLPEERAVRCEEEYKQVRTSWERLLKPHMKQ